MNRPKALTAYLQRIAALGGKASAASLTPAQRKARARKAALARWKPAKTPRR